MLRSRASVPCSSRRWIGPDDVLVLDRGYPAAWLVALLNARAIRFVMRCDNDSGWSAAKTFLRSRPAESCVMLTPPGANDVRDWGIARNHSIEAAMWNCLNKFN